MRQRLAAVAAACIAVGAFAQHAHHDHGKALAITDGAAAPTLKVEAKKDPVGGWNFHLVTTNFRFAPEHVNTQHVPGEGHAHIYIDGRKTRVYGPWQHIDGLAPGKHQVRATLNANSHEEFEVAGKRVEATLEIVQ